MIESIASMVIGSVRYIIFQILFLSMFPPDKNLGLVPPQGPHMIKLAVTED